ncbi:uncharacterized protein LOC107039741 [Diachasma alloeum]|uniref:uncharacterized protein LOC107039741 n=1 Tax=Diachasma alloeum TaxID=454923 RepID=UPI000738455C|nr:uncharacterized protein LOC107039741 [Diachasma alloeum]
MGRPRVIGAHLGKEIGNRVTLFGMIKAVSSNQTNVELLTPDNIKVNVSLPEPFTGLPEGGMEVFGIVKSKSTISADGYVYRTPIELEKFDPEAYQDYLILVNIMIGQDENIQAAFRTF